MKDINIKNSEYYLNILVLLCIAPIGYFAPLGEWILMGLLATCSLFKFIFNPYKPNYNSLLLVIIICLILSSSYLSSINTSRTLEVIGPNIGIIFSIYIIITISSKNNIIEIAKILGASIFITTLLIFFDLVINTEIRSTLAIFVGDEPTSISANYSRGLLILAALTPVVIGALYNSKKYIYAATILLLLSTIIFLGPNNSAKIALLCSFIAAIIVYFLGPKSFLSFGIISALFILFAPLLSLNFFSTLGKIEKNVEYTKLCNQVNIKDDNWIKSSDNYYCTQAIAWQKHPKVGSIMHRILVWEFVGKEILNRPILGHGLGTSRIIGQNIILKVPNTNVEIKGGIPLHPHNNILQVWLELGIIGIAILLYIWFKIIKYGFYIRSKSYVLGTATCSSIVSIFIICNLSFGFFQAWWISSIALIFLVIIQICNSKIKINNSL